MASIVCPILLYSYSRGAFPRQLLFFFYFQLKPIQKILEKEG